MGSSCYHDLPQDLLVDILSSLPVKTLLRCKCVCKDWYGLIKSPTFISKHFHHPNNNNRLLVKSFISRRRDDHIDDDIYCFPPKCVLSLFPNELEAGGPPLVPEVVDTPGPNRCFDIIGPLNGLFMVICCQHLVCGLALWNPATTEFRVLPLPSFNHQPPDCRWSRANFGFGWDPSTSNYKAVWFQFPTRINRGTLFAAAVYSLATDSWRQLDLAASSTIVDFVSSATKPFFDDFLGLCISTYLNGAYYWLSLDYTDQTLEIILFDMEREVFRVIPVPPQLNPDKYSSNRKNVELLLRDDSLALLLSEYSGEFVVSVDVWLMESEGCWTHHIVFQPLLEVYRPLAFWENGEALVFETRDMHLLLHNPYNKKCLDVNFRIKENERCFQIRGYDLKVYNYKESLVPVISGGGGEGSSTTGTTTATETPSVLDYIAQKLAKICQFSFVFFQGSLVYIKLLCIGNITV